MKERILSLLGSGVPAAMIPSAVGCTPGYVSQLLMDEDFKTKVMELRLIELTQEKTIDEIWNNIEEKLLKKFETSVDFFVKPKDILDALTKINAAKRKTKLDSGAMNLGGHGTVVNLNVPAIIVNKYTVNMSGNMVEVDGRTLTPMKSINLMKTLEERRSNGKEPKLLDAVIEQPKSREKTISVDSI